MAGWKAGAISIRCFSGEAPFNREVAGWINGPLGLDFRMLTSADAEYEFDVPGFVLTHIPTGYVVRHLHCGTAEAQEIASEILTAGDWSFDVPDGAAKDAAAPAVKAAMERHPDKVFSGFGGSLGPRP